MFRAMRRGRQQLPTEETEAILHTATSGVLALEGDGGYPYAVPLSFVYADGKLYFHCAKTGHKIDAIARSSKASFCVIARDEVRPETYTTHFRSVIAFGRIRILEDDAEKRAAIEKLAVKYAPNDSTEARNQAIDKEWAPLCMLEMSIDHLTGKEARELMQARARTQA